MGEYENVTMDMLYDKLQYLEKKIEEIETILLLPEEKLSETQLKELKEIRKHMLKYGGITLEKLEKKRKAD